MPIRVSEMLSTLDGCVYAERVCVTDIANINKAKRAIKKAFEKQMAGEGFTFVEVLSTCPTNWGMTPLKANEWLKDNMIPYYPWVSLRTAARRCSKMKKRNHHFRLRRPGRPGHWQESGRGRHG